MTRTHVIRAGDDVAEFGRNGLLSSWCVGLNQSQWSVLYPPYQQPSLIPDWPSGGCPILYPWAGRVWSDDQMGDFEFNGRKGHSAIHGYAYLRTQQLEHRTTDSLTFVLEGAPDTSFPWRNLTKITYTLSKRRLEIEISTCNLDQTAMPIAPGIHPFFDLGVASEWCVTIPAKKAYAVTDRGLAGQERSIIIEDRPCSDPELQSLILGELKSNSATLQHTLSGRTIDIEWVSDQSKFVVLWVNSEAGYFCLEPWSGLPDAVHNGQGLQCLASGETKTFHYVLRVSG